MCIFKIQIQLFLQSSRSLKENCRVLALDRTRMALRVILAWIMLTAALIQMSTNSSPSDVLLEYMNIGERQKRLFLGMLSFSPWSSFPIVLAAQVALLQKNSSYSFPAGLQ